jgi:hypothetical protein
LEAALPGENGSVPIKIGERKLGWRAGDLMDGLEERAQSSAKASAFNVREPV